MSDGKAGKESAPKSSKKESNHFRDVDSLRTSFKSIWPTIRTKVWRLLNQKQRTNILATSRYFKKEVELLGGLHTKLTSELSTNLIYIKKVETTRCRAMVLQDHFFQAKDGPPFRCRFNVRNLDILARMSSMIIREMILPMAGTLRYIEFRQMSLMSRYINPNDSSEESETEHFEFSHLISLTFHYGVLRHGELDNLKVFNANMIYLLKLISAPRLICFNVLAVHSILSGIVLDTTVVLPHEYLHWEGRPLKLFLVRHHKALRRLSLTLYRNKLTPEDQYFPPPKFLTEYACILPRLRPQLYDAGDPDKEFFSNYWSNILRQSKQLRNFAAQVENWGRVHRFRADLRSIIKNNYSTLQSILINSFHTRNPGLREHHLTLDMGVFSLCTALKVLHIRLASILKYNKKGQSESETYTAIGLEKLPTCIESLQFKNILCYTSDLHYVSKLPLLTSCQLLHCGRKGTHGVTFEIARALFTHKRIHYVKIYDFNEENNVHRIMTLVKKFNDGLYEQHVEIHNPMKKIPFFDYLPCCCCMKPAGGDSALATG